LRGASWGRIIEFLSMPAQTTISGRGAAAQRGR
jgi:hypothetical protein